MRIDLFYLDNPGLTARTFIKAIELPVSIISCNLVRPYFKVAKISAHLIDFRGLRFFKLLRVNLFGSRLLV